MTRFTNFGSRGGPYPRADLHRKPPSTMGHESLIQRRQSLSHPGELKYFFQTYNPLLLITIHLDICRCTFLVILVLPLSSDIIVDEGHKKGRIVSKRSKLALI